MSAWVARSHTLVVSGGVTLGFHCFSLGFLIISGFVFWFLFYLFFPCVLVYRLVKFAEFGYDIVYGFCCYFCHVGIIIKVGFIGDVLRYVFEFSTLF